MSLSIMYYTFLDSVHILINGLEYTKDYFQDFQKSYEE